MPEGTYARVVVSQFGFAMKEPAGGVWAKVRTRAAAKGGSPEMRVPTVSTLMAAPMCRGLLFSRLELGGAYVVPGSWVALPPVDHGALNRPLVLFVKAVGCVVDPEVGWGIMTGRACCPNCGGRVLECTSVLKPHRTHPERPKQYVCTGCALTWCPCGKKPAPLRIQGLPRRIPPSAFEHIRDESCTALLPFRYNGALEPGQTKGKESGKYRCFAKSCCHQKTYVPIGFNKNMGEPVRIERANCCRHTLPKGKLNTCPMCLGPKCCTGGGRCTIVPERCLMTPGQVVREINAAFSVRVVNGLTILDGDRVEAACRTSAPVCAALMCFARPPAEGLKSSCFLPLGVRKQIGGFAGRGIDLHRVYAAKMLGKAMMVPGIPRSDALPHTAQQRVDGLFRFMARFEKKFDARTTEVAQNLVRVLEVVKDGSVRERALEVLRNLTHFGFSDKNDAVFQKCMRVLDGEFRTWRALWPHLSGTPFPDALEGQPLTFYALRSRWSGRPSSECLCPTGHRVETECRIMFKAWRILNAKHERPHAVRKVHEWLCGWVIHSIKETLERRRYTDRLQKMCPLLDKSELYREHGVSELQERVLSMVNGAYRGEEVWGMFFRSYRPPFHPSRKAIVEILQSGPVKEPCKRRPPRSSGRPSSKRACR